VSAFALHLTPARRFVPRRSRLGSHACQRRSCQIAGTGRARRPRVDDPRDGRTIYQLELLGGSRARPRSRRWGPHSWTVGSSRRCRAGIATGQRSMRAVASRVATHAVSAIRRESPYD